MQKLRYDDRDFEIGANNGDTYSDILNRCVTKLSTPDRLMNVTDFDLLVMFDGNHDFQDMDIIEYFQLVQRSGSTGVCNAEGDASDSELKLFSIKTDMVKIR